MTDIRNTLRPFIAEVETLQSAPVETVDGNPRAALPAWAMSANRETTLSARKCLSSHGHDDKPAGARDALTKTVPKARIIPNMTVVNITGEQYERCMTAEKRAMGLQGDEYEKARICLQEKNQAQGSTTNS